MDLKKIINYLQNNQYKIEDSNKDISLLDKTQLVELRNHIFNNKLLYENNINAIFIWGKIEKHLNIIEAAINCFKLVLQINPNHIESLRELGFLYAENGALNDALNYFEKITKLDKKDWQAFNDGGCTLRGMGKIKESCEWMKEAIKTNTTSVQIAANIALLEFELNNYEEAQKYLDIAFAIDENYPEALHTQAMLYSGMGKHKESYEMDKKSLQFKPDYPQAKLGLALTALIMGNLEEGFAGYEHRWVGSDKSDKKLMVTLKRPWWLGQKVYLQSIIGITPEQGFGDMIQFARFIPLLTQIFHMVKWFVPIELYRLMAFSFNSENIVVESNVDISNINNIDYELPIMSLPLALNINLNNLPAKEIYLRITNEQKKYWENKLKNINGLKVGVAWTGNATLSKHELRTIKTELLEIINSDDISFFSLQKFVREDMIENPPFTNFYNFMEECNDFMDTAALIHNLDLVISVDTVIVHLSAALGKPTWLLNRFGSEWRWMDRKIDSPWYPTIKIYNQTDFKNWENVLLSVKTDLIKFSQNSKRNMKLIF